MDSVTIGALLLAVISGAGEGLGTRLWDGVVALVRRPIHCDVTAGDTAAAMASGSAGEAELAALQRAPADKAHAEALARVLLARAGADAGFGRVLQTWWEEAGPIRATIGNVTSVISGGTQHGPVLQGRDFSNITFGAAPAAPTPVPRRRVKAPE
jgi:hypothetical protein